MTRSPSSAASPYITHLLRDIAGCNAYSLKSASYAALLLEERFVRDGWPVGEFVASADELQDKFELGRATCREALGILQARGFIRVRRGRSGGVVISRPDFAELVDSFVLHLTLARATVVDVLQALRVMRLVAVRWIVDAKLSHEDLRCLHRSSIDDLATSGASSLRDSLPVRLAMLIRNPALQRLVLLMEAMAAVSLQRSTAVETFNLEPANIERLISAILWRDVETVANLLNGDEPLHAQDYELVDPQALHCDTARETKLAGYVAAKLVFEMASTSCHEGQRLASENAIAERLEVGVPVVRQAIRILEDMGAVYTQRGAGGGLMRGKSLQSSMIRQVFAYFLGMDLPLEQSLDCAERLAREASALAAQHSASLTPELRASWLASLTMDKNLDARRFVAIENSIHENLGNPAIAICARALACYNAWRVSKKPHVMPSYITATREVLDSIASHDVAGAYKAQAWKNQLLREQME